MRADRLVLDTNVLISAALQPKGPPRAVLDHLRGVRGALILSEQAFDEVRTRLMRPKFDRYLSVDAGRAFLVELAAAAEWVVITGAVMGCRDRDDDAILETALTGEAEALVTGDEDLLVLSPFRGLEVVRPAELLRRLSSGGGLEAS